MISECNSLLASPRLLRGVKTPQFGHILFGLIEGNKGCRLQIVTTLRDRVIFAKSEWVCGMMNMYLLCSQA